MILFVSLQRTCKLLKREELNRIKVEDIHILVIVRLWSLEIICSIAAREKLKHVFVRQLIPCESGTECHIISIYF